jgi:predicted nucleotidyltransferase component of viral defense system
MHVPRRNDIPHKVAMYRLLNELLSDAVIATNIKFKGGTCAAMLGYLDRFSVDLDFDLPDITKREILRPQIHKVINKLGYTIKDESNEFLQFFIKYRDIPNKRSIMKLEIVDIVSEGNIYEEVRLIEIDKMCSAQTVETMFANKLVALKARFDEGKSIAGRDMYDIHHFFNQGYDINDAVIENMCKTTLALYAQELIEFIENRVTQHLIMEDLNPLLPAKIMNKILPRIKQEVIIALRELT